MLYPVHKLLHYFKFDWYGFVKETYNVQIVEQNLDKFDENIWSILSDKPNFIHILKNNLDKVDWENLEINYGSIDILFTLDYLQMKENNKKFCCELVKKLFNPIRINNFASLFNIDFMGYLDYY